MCMSVFFVYQCPAHCKLHTSDPCTLNITYLWSLHSDPYTVYVTVSWSLHSVHDLLLTSVLCMLHNSYPWTLYMMYFWPLLSVHYIFVTSTLCALSIPYNCNLYVESSFKPLPLLQFSSFMTSIIHYPIFLSGKLERTPQCLTIKFFLKSLVYIKIAASTLIYLKVVVELKKNYLKANITMC